MADKKIRDGAAVGSVALTDKFEVDTGADTHQYATAAQIIAALFNSGNRFTNALGADVNLNNVANYFDGPSVAQGSTGTWLVIGQVTVYDSAGLANVDAKLWDGTTVLASGFFTTVTANAPVTITLAGIITSPAGNLRISVKDQTSVNGKIAYNFTGNQKDSTIIAIRIA